MGYYGSLMYGLTNGASVEKFYAFDYAALEREIRAAQEKEKQRMNTINNLTHWVVWHEQGGYPVTQVGKTTKFTSEEAAIKEAERLAVDGCTYYVYKCVPTTKTARVQVKTERL